MIILDTHIWVWWVHNDKQLPDQYIQHKYSHVQIAPTISVDARESSDEEHS